MRVGIVGDIHLPFEHPRYLDFCCDVFGQWQVDYIHLIGDVVDGHALSFYDHNPNGRSAEDEAALTLEKVQRWHKKFPAATVSVGNHDARHFRVARRTGLPDRFVQGYADVWCTPGWRWGESFVLDGVLYEHGVGTSGKDAALNRALQHRCSVVMGHVHSWAGVKWHTSPSDRIFGLNVGCGIDIDTYAFEYARPFSTRPVLGCGVVLDGEYAYFEPMLCGRGERYYKREVGDGKDRN
jgi:predicted phosphodiesterase